MKRNVLSICLGIIILCFPALEASADGSNAALPILLNVLPGFGLGSFIQGDTAGGWALLAGDAVSVGLFLGGWLAMWGNFTLDFSESSDGPGSASYVCFSGLILYGVFRIVGILLPILYKPDNGGDSFQARAHATIDLAGRPAAVIAFDF